MALASIDAAAEKLLADVRTTVVKPELPKKLKRVTLMLEEEEYDKLQALAVALKASPEEALRRFIRASQPGGSGWHPSVNLSKPEPK